MNESRSPQDEMLWKKAKKRVDFKRHLFTYILVNGFLWAIWFFTGEYEHGQRFPWPLWATLGWGIGLAFNFYSAYIDNKGDAVEREYEKLKRERGA